MKVEHCGPVTNAPRSHQICAGQARRLLTSCHRELVYPSRQSTFSDWLVESYCSGTVRRNAYLTFEQLCSCQRKLSTLRARSNKAC